VRIVFGIEAKYEIVFGIEAKYEIKAKAKLEVLLWHRSHRVHEEL